MAKITFLHLVTVLVFLQWILPCGGSAQTVTHIIPAPKSVKKQTGFFGLNHSTSICVEKMTCSETVFAATELAMEVQSELGFSPIVSDKQAGKPIYLILTGRDKKNQELLANQKMVDFASIGEEGYLLDISPAQIIIAAPTEAGIFYGVQSLKQIIRTDRIGERIPCLSVADKPSMRYRGWMDDISRGPIPIVEFIKKEIRTMAEFKQNFFNLYTENTFRSEKFPDISPIDGITPAEIKELSVYAAKYHIELMGNFQSFGHQEKMLANPFYTHLADNGSILNPSDESTYDFLSGIYSEMIPAYSSNFFNINCDETEGLGKGKSKAMADSLGVSGIYAYHINRLDKLIKPYGKRLMMWGDIAVNNKDIINRLPKDLVILSWGYQAAESFDDAINPFVKSGFDFMVAPGVGCWGELWPAIGNAAVNISNYVRDGAKLGAMGMMNTAWDDNGHNLFEYNWHGLAWGAECSWNPASPLQGVAADSERDEKLRIFNANFDAVFFQVQGITDLYFQIDSLRFRTAKGLLGESGFWEDILDFFPSNTTKETVSANLEVAAEATQLIEQIGSLQKLARRNTANPDFAEFALRRVVFAAHKNIARVHLYVASQGNDPEAIRKVKQELQSLVGELHGIKITYMQLWERENRNWWLDKNMNDYNKLADRLINLDKQVYIEPSVDVIDGQRLVTLHTLFHDQAIIYTTDGTEPIASSAVYESPLPVSSKTLIKAAVLLNGQPFGLSQKLVFVHLGIGKLRKLNAIYSNYNPVYAAGGDMALLDGLKGSGNFADGCWQGFQGQDLNIEIDLKKTTIVHSVSLECLQNTYSWIVLPASVSIYSSDDGTNYTLLKTIEHHIPMDTERQLTHTFASEFDNLNTRYLKVIAKSTGLLTSWHHASGNESFIFADEIVIE
ncbi:MAG: glycoside hydrolase family 20 zincin-like fold domain-containing protein [Bacteroidota bacterium]